MDFRILGPLEAADGAGRLVPLNDGKQKALLALLLIHAGELVPVTRLVDGLWGSEPPETARKMVQIFVSQLRKQLPEGLVQTRGQGYLLELGDDTLDLRSFERLAREGRDALAAGEADAAAEVLREALSLWRGPALGDLQEPFARLESDRLDEQRLACLEERIDADLARGCHAELVGELEALAREHPHRERPRGQLMLALYRSGRHGEALESYQAYRRMLADELGIDPPARVRDLERRMLQQDPGLDPLPAVEAPAPRPAVAATGASCPSCGEEVPGDARFCPSCAAPLAAPDAPDEMLKVVTVLFADVVGSTARAERLHPEDVRALMADYFDAMAGEIRAEGGTIEKFVGDGIMAVFGVPTAREDDAVRAVRAARRMLDRLARWNEEREEPERLEVRVGLNTGDVVASGAPGDDLLVTGDAVNVAARLHEIAEPGTIVVGQRTARAARSHFELRALGEPVGLKGRSEAAAAWVVVDARETSEPRGVPGLVAPLVGRDRELVSLLMSYDRVSAERRPEVVTLVGDAGVGKSRLVRELLSRLRDDATVLAGRCLPHGRGAALAPLGEILREQAGVLDTDGADTALAKVERLVEAACDADLATDPKHTAAALASTLGLPAGAAGPLGELDPRDLHRELLAAWRVLLASLARRGPVVAVVEDLHWADLSLLDALDELSERLEGPILFLCTARPDLLRLRPGWGGGRRSSSSLPIDPLGKEESARLVSLLLDVETLPEHARRRILDRSDGNPFFLEEIVRHLIDEGLLTWDEGRWRAGQRIDEVDVPDSVQAVILARLDLLSPEEKRVAQHAAVVGRVFWDGAVAATVEVDDLDEALTTLRRREFVVERVSSSIAGQREFAFKHALLRDVAYESLLRRARGRAHAETAAWIVRAAGARADDVQELLAHHYEAAWSYLRSEELRAEARTHLLAAAATAQRCFACGQGERLAGRAVELCEAGPERVEALEALGDLHSLAFTGDAAWQAYREALAELREDDPAWARIAGKAGMFGARYVGTMHRVPDVDVVREMIETGLRAAVEPGPARTLLLVALGFLLVQREGRTDAAADAAVAEAVAAAEALGDADLHSAALDLAQAREMHSGRYGDLHRTSTRRIELIPRLRVPTEVGDAYAMAAGAALHVGRYREADEHATACIERAEGVDVGSYLHGLTWRVAVRFVLGRWDEALADQAELERVAEVDPRDLPAAYTMRAYAYAGLCHTLRGDDAAAEPYLDVSLRFVRERPPLHGAGALLHSPPLALALAQRERFGEALDVIRLEPRSASSGMVLEALCEIAGARGRWDDASRLVAEARAEAEVGGQASLPLLADRLEGRVAAAAGDVARAAVLLRRSADGFAALEAPWEEAWSRLLLGEALAGEGGSAGPELTAALEAFERLGSVRQADRARAALHTV